MFAFVRLRQATVSEVVRPAAPSDGEASGNALTRGPYRYLWIRTVRVAGARRGARADARVARSSSASIGGGYLVAARAARDGGVHRPQLARALRRTSQRRGLEPPALVIADAIPGLDEALAEVFPGVPRQRCLPSLLRQLEGHVPPSERPALRASMRAVTAQPDAAAARQQLQRMRRELRRRWPAAAVILDDAPAAQLSAFTEQPRAYWSRLASTQVLVEDHRGRHCRARSCSGRCARPRRAGRSAAT